jgi:transketolase
MLLSGDHGYSLFDDFRLRSPDKFLNVGVAESNLVTVAAGLSNAGFLPMIYGLSSFVPSRVYEFLKLQIALPKTQIIVVGDGAGVVYSTLGHSHQSLDDLALMRALPGFQVLSPSSDFEAEESVALAASYSGPTYIRLGKSGGIYEGAGTSDNLAPYVIEGEGCGKNAVIAHGSMVSKALEVRQASGMHFDIISWANLTSFRPEDLSLIRSYQKVAVVEEHIQIGSLGLTLSNILRQHELDFLAICAPDAFHSRVGSYEWTLGQLGLDASSVNQRLEDFFS